VADGRNQAHKINKSEGKPLATDWETYADGRVFSGQRALNYGFVDELGDFDKAVERTKKIAGIHNANLVEYRMRYDISDFFRMFGQSESSHTIKLDLGTEFPKLRAGELYFLSTTIEN
jgi:protease-4